jgi:hypothetical protein
LPPDRAILPVLWRDPVQHAVAGQCRVSGAAIRNADRRAAPHAGRDVLAIVDLKRPRGAGRKIGRARASGRIIAMPL